LTIINTPCFILSGAPPRLATQTENPKKQHRYSITVKLVLGLENTSGSATKCNIMNYNKVSILVIVVKVSEEIRKRHVIYYKTGTVFTNMHTDEKTFVGSDIRVICIFFILTHLMFTTLQHGNLCLMMIT
jgi:hypothetical protein